MVVCTLLGLALLRSATETEFTHAPGPTDTVRYNRDEFGVRLHVPDGWKGRPVLLFSGPKDSIRTAPTVPLGPKTFRARFRAGAEPRYAFWVDPAKYKSGATGLIFDQSGLHSANAPTWFDQAAAQYPEVKPPQWPGEGAVFYALDTDKFGDGTNAESGAQSFTKHLDYVQALGVNAIWLSAVHSDSGDAVEDAHHIDWHVVAEGATSPKGVDGIAGSTLPEAKGWRIELTDDDDHVLIQAGSANGVQDRRWDQLVYGFIRDIGETPGALAAGLENLRSDYPDSVANQMVTRLAGPGRPRPSAVFRGDRKRLQQLWLLLLTLPGVPVIDAGDEIGLVETGEEMQWSPTQQDATVLDTVKKLVLLRTQRPSLYRGEYRVLDLDDENHAFGFSRVDRREATIVVVNNSDDSQTIRVPVAEFGATDLRTLFGSLSFTQYGTSISLTVPGHGFAMIGN